MSEIGVRAGIPSECRKSIKRASAMLGSEGLGSGAPQGVSIIMWVGQKEKKINILRKIWVWV